MIYRAYSTLTTKVLDDEQRIIEGMASTPEPDRVGDIVEASGAKFKTPLSLLLFHDKSKPVGTVKLTRSGEEGIRFKASFPDPTDMQSTTLRDRILEAWESVKTGIIRGVSIGFRPLEDGMELIRETGGIRFTKIEILELSLVVVPANASSTIETIKSIDAQYVAAPGSDILMPVHPAGAPATTRRAVYLTATREDRSPMKVIADQIKDYQNELTAKTVRMNELMKTANEAGRTLDTAEEEEHDRLVGEVAGLDKHLVRLAEMEKRNKAAAIEVSGNTQEQASASRSGVPVVTVREQTLPPGIEFARAVLCKVAAFLEAKNGNYVSAEAIAKVRYPTGQRIHQYLKAQADHYMKTAVAGATTLDTTWAAPLLADPTTLAADFLDYLRPQTIIGKFGTGGIPSLRRVPFNVRIQSATAGGSASWVGQGKPKPLTKFAYDATTLLFTKIAAITVITEELARFSSPSAETLVRDQLAQAVIERMDTDFIDPAKAAVANVNPASITNGLTAQSSAGTSAANVLTDLQNLLEAFILSNVNPNSLVLIMPNTLALVLSLTENSLGQPAFNGITMNGGTLRGIPVITSQYAASGASFGNMVIAVNAQDVALADDGQVTVDASKEASLQMDDAPTNDSSTGTGASVVSMFQTNSIALRAERFINWKKLRSSAVVYMDDVNWGSIGSPV